MSGESGPEDGGERSPRGLDPAEDPDGWERRVEAITAAAEPELRRRREEARSAPFPAQLERWARPVLAAAAAVIVAGTALLALAGAPGRSGSASLAAASDAGETLVSPVVDPWLERDTVTIGAVEEIVTARTSAGEGRP